jgi:C4-dicarboxylate-specific signal transduction histidine kinase
VIFKDNRRGISSEYIDCIFEPFFTTQLGIGGSISVISSEGEGAIFKMILPFVAQASTN